MQLYVVRRTLFAIWLVVHFSTMLIRPLLCVRSVHVILSREIKHGIVGASQQATLDLEDKVD